MSNYRKVWSDTFGKPPKGFEIHHIKPRCEGGKDTIGNLIALHPDDHRLIHKLRGDKWLRGNTLLWMKGYSDSDETKLKKSLSARKPKTKEHCSNISKAKIDKEVRHFIHEDGKEEYLTPYDLRMKYSLSQPNLSRAINKSRSVSGWRVYG